MTRKAFLILMLMAISLSSCVYSLFPIYTEDTIVYNSDLLGEWNLKNGQYQLKFEAYEKAKPKQKFNLDSRQGSYKEEDTERSYKLTVDDLNDPNSKESFQAHLVQIGDFLFLDLIPLNEYRNANLSNNYMALHSFAKLSFNEKELRLSQFDLGKLNELFESNLIRLRHETVNGTVMITAQPKELQKFLERYAEDESVFEDTQLYQKQR